MFHLEEEKKRTITRLVVIVLFVLALVAVIVASKQRNPLSKIVDTIWITPASGDLSGEVIFYSESQASFVAESVIGLELKDTGVYALLEGAPSELTVTHIGRFTSVYDRPLRELTLSFDGEVPFRLRVTEVNNEQMITKYLRAL